MKFRLALIMVLCSSSAFAWDYSTSPCTPPADLNAADSTSNYHSPDSAANDAVTAEIQKSMGADIVTPLTNYSATAPAASDLYIGSVTMNEEGKPMLNGTVPLGTSDSGSTTPPPCREESKPAPVETK